jgi:hypothetical protein
MTNEQRAYLQTLMPKSLLHQNDAASKTMGNFPIRRANKIEVEDRLKPLDEYSVDPTEKVFDSELDDIVAKT